MLINLKTHFLTVLAASLALVSPCANAVSSTEGELYLTQDSRRVLSEYQHQGDTYVVGEPGRPYSIWVRNPTPSRVLAVVSVDGLNVLDGKSASFAGSGYVLMPFGEVEIKGWRKSLDEVARFSFSRPDRAYATRVGRPDDLGVIGVALFRERQVVSRRYGRSLEEPGALANKMAGLAPLASGQLGTGHGPRELAPATETAFERASVKPNDVLSLQYDTYGSLVSRRIIQAAPLPRNAPNAFPSERAQQWAPDPRE